MIYNQEQLIKHNIKFFDSFIDLKVVGWKSYSKALNEYTFGFFKTSLESTDESIENIGKTMKSTFSTIKGVCK
jgi:hypothetical protein